MDELLSGLPGLILVTALVFGATILLFWLLLGTGARWQHQRTMAQRMAVAKGGRKSASGDATPVRPDSGGWIPSAVAQYGGKVAEAGGFGQKLDHQLEQAGFPLKGGEVVVVTVLAAVGGGLLALVLGQPLVLMLIVGAATGTIPFIMLRLALRKRDQKLRDQIPDVLTIMASSLRAGHSFLQALDTVSKEIEEPAATEFNRAIAEIRLGRPTEEALNSMADRVGSEDFKWAVLAINIQREVGGNLAEILDTVADTIRDRARIRRDVDTLTTEGRLSAYILLAMPFAIAGYLMIVNPSYLELLWTTLPGVVMVVIAGCLMSVGTVWMRKIIKIDV